MTLRARSICGMWSLGLVALAAGCLFAPIVAVADTIEVSMTEIGAGTGCQMSNDSGPGLRTVYVRHFSPGSLGSRFMVSLDASANLTYLSETHAFPATLGNTQEGISICYGDCTAFAVVAAITYMYVSQTVNCPQLRVVPHPAAETIQVINCYGVAEVASAQDMYIVQPFGLGCGCPTPHIFTGTSSMFDCTPLAVEETTWGAVKALYR